MPSPTSHDDTFRDTFKVVLAGPEATGKSVLFSTLLKRKFEEQYFSTIGAEFGNHTLSIENKPVKLQVWDLGGDKKWQSVSKIYFPNLHIVLIACDLSSEKFISNVKDYVKKVLEEPEFAKANTPIILVGTKKDELLEGAEKKLSELQSYLNQQGYKCTGYYITSAKTGEGIEELFRAVATDLVLQQQLEEKQDAKPKIGLWNHSKEHPKRYILGLLLAAAIAVVLTVPVIGQAVGLAGAIGFLVANTAWQLGLLATGAALVGFAACMLGGKLIDKIKQPREDQQERLLEHEKTSDYRNSSDTATISETSSISGQPVYDHPAGMGTSKTPAQTEQPGSTPHLIDSPNQNPE